MKKYRSVIGSCFFLLLLFGFSSVCFSLDLSLFGPLRYTQITTEPTVHIEKVMGDPMKAPRWLIIRNGEEGGINRVTKAKVILNGITVVSPLQVNSSVDSFEKRIKLKKKTNTIKIKLWGSPGSYIVFTIAAKNVTQVPQVVRLSQAKAESLLADAAFSVGTVTKVYHGFVPSGSVIAQNPKGGTFAQPGSPITLTISLGLKKLYDRLPGLSTTKASAAVRDYNTHDTVAASEIEEVSPGVKIARTKLMIAFKPNATVGQINSLLTSINGKITAMLKGVNQVIIRIPDPGSIAALDTLIAQIQSNPSVRYGLKGTMSSRDALPPNFNILDPSTPWDWIDHHLDVRAHAAWNVKDLLRFGQPPTVAVVDYFGDGPPNDDFALFMVDDDFAPPGNLDAHGYHVLGIIAATFGGTTSERGMATGMYPGAIPLMVVDYQNGYDDHTAMVFLIQQLKITGGRVIVNSSMASPCPSPVQLACIEPYIHEWLQLVRGWNLYDSGQTRMDSANLENNFLHIASAGNIQAPGDTDASLNSQYTGAHLLSGLVSPSGNPIVNLTNTLVIENREKSPTPLEGLGCRADDSKFPGDLSAIGTNVFSLAGATIGTDIMWGTSMATPQVAGLAAYLWALKPSLSPQDIKDILIRTADTSSCGGTDPRPLIDAYGAILALDRGYNDASVRGTLLDVADASGALGNDWLFTEKDIEAFLNAFEASNGTKDYSRFDLNGDGMTGGTDARSFNLDMDYPPAYETVYQTIEDNIVSFDENSLNDLQVLCYYAYSPLYTGSDTKRRDLLADKCSICGELGNGFEEGLVAAYSNGRQTFEGPINHGWDWNCPGDSIYEYNLYQNVCTPLSMSPAHWAKGGWDGSDDPTAFNVFWSGYLFAPKDGDYYFGGWVDGIVSIEINGEVVANMDTTGSSYGHTMTLQGGNWVPISMSFSTNGGSNNMRLGWRLPGAASGDYVPRACLKHQAGP